MGMLDGARGHRVAIYLGYNSHEIIPAMILIIEAHSPCAQASCQACFACLKSCFSSLFAHGL